MSWNNVIPGHIALEILKERERKKVIPTHIVVPAGEWSLADTFSGPTAVADAMAAAKRYADSGKEARVYQVTEKALFEAKSIKKLRKQLGTNPTPKTKEKK